MSYVKNYNEACEALYPHLREYLQEQGIDTTNNFNCINPDHDDHHPSMGIAPSGNVAHCFSCGMSIAIFQAAHILEKKPMVGQEFIQENLLYLADKYGVQVETEPLTEEQIYKYDTYRAYKSAAELVSNEKSSEQFENAIKQRGWTRDICKEYGVGCVPDYKEFRETLKRLGFSASFIDDVDLGRKEIFGEDRLIFTIRDARGRPVGFASRNLSYTEDKLNGKKYVNQMGTGLKCNIYKKSTRLFGLDRVLAKRNKKPEPVYIFEGYSDVVTAAQHEVINTVAVGSSTLTAEQVSLLKEHHCYNVILCFDGDEAGRKRTADMLDTVLSGHKDLRVSIIVMPDGFDPDSFIREYGINKFKRLKQWSAFEWRLSQFPEDTDAEIICESMIPLIVNESSHVSQEKMCNVLAKNTGITLKTIQQELERLQNAKSHEKARDRQEVLNKLTRELQKAPEDAEEAIRNAENKLFDLAKQYNDDAFSEESCLGELDAQKTVEEEKDGSFSGFLLGSELSLFEKHLNGQWRKDVWLCVGGQPNSGKCIAFDAEIVNPLNGEINTIEDIVKNKPGNYVFTNDNGYIEKVIPSAYYDSGIQETLTITNKLGMSITGTYDHPVLTLNGWKKLKDLTTDDAIAMPSKIDLDHLPDFPINDNEIKLLAYFLTEGCLTRGPGITNANDAIVDDFIISVKELFEDTVDIRTDNKNDPNRCNSYFIVHNREKLRAKRKVIVDQIKNARLNRNLTVKELALKIGCKESVITHLEKDYSLGDLKLYRKINNFLCLEENRKNEWFICYVNPAHGMLEWWGINHTKAINKSIPKPVFSFSKRQLSIFLSCIWDTDGSYTCSRQRNTIEIGLSSKRFVKQLQHLLLRLGIISYFRYKKVYLKNKLFNSWVLSITSYKYMSEFIHNTYSLNKEHKRQIILNQKSNRNCYCIKKKYNDLLFIKLKSIERSGLKQVYDLTINSTHNFIANDIVVHNTSFLCKLAYAIAKQEDNNACVIYHSIDDTMEQVRPKFVAIAEGSRKLSINAITDPNYHKRNNPDLNIDERREEGYQEVRELVKNGRLILKDANHGMSLSFADRLIHYYKTKFPDRNVVYILDNFHKLQDFKGGSEERIRVKDMSTSMKGLATKHHICVITTVEYRKTQNNQKAGNQDIAETIQIEYDANLIAHVHNDLHQKKSKAKLYHQETVDGEPTDCPTIEIEIGKNKITSFKNSLYFDFFPHCSDFISVSEQEVKYRQDKNKGEEVNEKDSQLF